MDDYDFTDPAQTDALEKFRNCKNGINLKHGRVTVCYYRLVEDE